MNLLNKEIKIVHFSTGKFLRGGERQVIFLHTGLLGKGIQSFLFCKKNSELSSQKFKNIIQIPFAGEWDLLAFFRFAKQCLKIRPHIIHCHDGHSLTFGVVAGKIFKIPVIYTRRVVFPIKRNPLNLWKYSLCNFIIAISNTVAEECKKIFPEENVFVVNDSVNWNLPILTKQEAKSKLNISTNNFLIGTVAYFTKEKNLDLILYLGKRLKEQQLNAEIVCIGPYDKNILKTKDIPDNIRLIGKINDAYLYYNAFDLYISTSYSEGLGTACLDAVVRNIPCVAIDAGGTKEIFPNDNMLVSKNNKEAFADKVIKVINNYLQAKEEAKIYCEYARNLFSIELMVEKTVKIYQKIGKQ